MGVIYSKVKLSSLGKNDKFTRLDFKFNEFLSRNDWNLFNCKDSELCLLKDILTPYYKNFDFEPGKEYKGIPTGREYLNEFGEITDYQIITSEQHPGRLKYQVNNDCILLSSLKGAKTPALSFDFNLNDYVFSNGFYIFKVNEEQNEKKFILYLLRTKTIKDFLDNHLFRGIGISTFREDDFLRIRIKKLTLQRQQQILATIAPLEAEIASLKATKIPETDIINKVLGKELGLDWEKFEELKKIKKYKANLSDFSKNVDSRMSYKFHNLAEKYLWDFMISKSDKRLKNFISEPIVLGESVSPEQYTEEGKFYYIAMSNIKFWNFETDDCRTVKKSYSDKAIKKGKIVKKDDIILARSGEGTIGKVALITDDVNAIFADFTQRIRLNNYNPLCAYYYFRSDIFQYFIYSHKKGMGNNTNIFPNQVQEFPMPDWSLEKQSKIATLIKEQIDAQKIIDEQILKKQQQILQIIENAVR